MSGGRRMEHMLKRTLCLQLSIVGLRNALELQCIFWHWKLAVCGRQDKFIDVSGNSRRKHASIGPFKWTMTMFTSCQYSGYGLVKDELN